MIARVRGLGAALLLAACAGQKSAAPPDAQPERTAPVAAAQSAPAPAPPAAPAAAKVAEPIGDEEGVIAEEQLCLSCHTAELIQNARIAEAGWKAEIVKMRNWGAMVEEDKVDPLATWFARRYPLSQSPPVSAMISTAAAVAAVAPERSAHAIHGDATAGASTYAKDCASCHGANAEGTGGGPVLIDAPVLYQPNRFSELTKKGKGRMPAFDVLSNADVNNLLTYLRALH